MARYRPDGLVEFLGRRDFQVKLRGHRIELGEIESILLTHPQVHEAAVIVRKDQPVESQLVAYLCTSEDLNSEGNGSGATGLRAELRQSIRDKLPGYMLPAGFVLLRTMPRTPEGKTDRLSLPLPPAESYFTSDIFVAPRNPAEETMARIWSSVFAVEKIGIRDNFFDLGGQSLMAVSIFIKIEQEFGRKLW